MRRELDLLGFAEERDFSHTFRLGEAEAAGALRHFTTTTMNEQPIAHLALDCDLLPPEPLDYFAPLTVIATHGDYERPLFSGAITEAGLRDQLLEIDALGAVLLGEQTVPEFAASGVPTPELFHFLARSAGVAEENLRIEGLDELPEELFEVVAPIEGVQVSERVRVAGITLLPGELLDAHVAPPNGGDLAKSFDASACAVALVGERRMLDAEERGIRHIDEALAWLTARGHYGTALLPNGVAQRFSRAEALGRARRGASVVVRGLATQRRWMHLTTHEGEAQELKLHPDHRFLERADAVRGLNNQMKLALLALARATSEADRLARVGALWEAIEFFVGNYAPPRLFSKQERQAMVASLPTELNAAQRTRAEKLINEQLNSAPLRRRLEDVLDLERIPHTDSEIATLFGLRDVRNNALHGRARSEPGIEELQQATAFVARLLVYRIWRRSRNNQN